MGAVARIMRVGLMCAAALVPFADVIQREFYADSERRRRRRRGCAGFHGY